MTPILQSRLPLAPWLVPHMMRLPGTQPVPLDDWLVRDEAFAAQMALRDQLIAERPGDVHAMQPGCRTAAEELLAAVLARLGPGYRRGANSVRRPDGVTVPLAGPPLVVAGRLVQEDLLVLEKPEGAAEHRLTGGILCFPSNWTLAQKMGRGLARIHLPVERYDADVARRVQRLFDGLRPEAPILRANLLVHGDGALWSPRPEYDRHVPEGSERFVRVERQVLVRLPVTRAVVFSIHTYMIRPGALTEEERETLVAVCPDALGSTVAPG